MTDRCHPFFKVVKKRAGAKWTEECGQAFGKLKKYLDSPSLLVMPQGKEDLYLYLAVSFRVVSVALVREEQGTQYLVYYVSKAYHEAKS